jgi:putative DNA primase/helicase
VGPPALWLETLNGIFADNPDKIQIIRQFAAYCLVPKTYFPCVLFQIGSGGNGKSVPEDVLCALLGQENVSHVSLKWLENRFGIVELKGKLLNTCGETETGVLDVTSLKEVTTGQEVQAEQKYSGDVKFNPMVKFLISINAFPKIRERSDALWRRIIPVEYRQHFGTGEGSHPKKDRIQEKIIAEELDAVFLWALEVLPAVLDSGEIAIPETCGLDFDNFKSAVNPLFDFAREALVFHENATVKPPDLYRVYQSWAKDGGANRPIGKHGFYEQIRLHYRSVRRVRPNVLPGQQSSVEVFQGVGILEGSPWAQPT